MTGKIGGLRAGIAVLAAACGGSGHPRAQSTESRYQQAVAFKTAHAACRSLEQGGR
jgi:hypothetical protein